MVNSKYHALKELLHPQQGRFAKEIQLVESQHAGGDSATSAVLQQLMDLSPRGIRTHLGLSKPIYARTAAYGHFGRKPEADGGFSWERVDLVPSLRSALA